MVEREVRLKFSQKMVRAFSRYSQIYSKPFLGRVLKISLLKKMKKSTEDRQRLRELERQLKEAENITLDKEQAIKKVKDLENRVEQTQAKIDSCQEEHGSNVESESELRRLQQLKNNFQKHLEETKKWLTALQKLAKDKRKEQAKADKLKADLATKEKERNTLEEELNDTKTLDDLNEQEAKLLRQNEEDRAINNDENASPSEREAAQGRVEERRLRK